MLETITLEKSIKYALPIAQKLYDKIAKPLIENKVLNLIDRRIELGNFKHNSISYLASPYGQSSIINTISACSLIISIKKSLERSVPDGLFGLHI